MTKSTESFIKNNRLLGADVFHLVPLPGTPVWDYAINRGLVSEDMDFRILGGQKADKDTIFLSEKIGMEEMVKLMKMFGELSKKRSTTLKLRRRLSYIYQDPLSIPGKVLRMLKRRL